MSCMLPSSRGPLQVTGSQGRCGDARWSAGAAGSGGEVGSGLPPATAGAAGLRVRLLQFPNGDLGRQDRKVRIMRARSRLYPCEASIPHRSGPYPSPHQVSALPAQSPVWRPPGPPRAGPSWARVGPGPSVRSRTGRPARLGEMLPRILVALFVSDPPRSASSRQRECAWRHTGEPPGTLASPLGRGAWAAVSSISGLSRHRAGV